MSINYLELFEELKTLKITTRHKKEHLQNSFVYLELARKLDDIFGTSKFKLFELCIEKYREGATILYGLHTGKTLAKLALFAKMDMQRILEGYYRDYKTENGGI